MHDNYSICLLNTKSFCHGLKAALYDIEWKSFFLAQPWQLTFKVSFAVALNGKISESFLKSQIYTKLRIAFFLQGFKVQEVTKSNFSEKKNHLGEKPKISSKIGFLVFDQNSIYWPVFCTLKWHGAMLFMILQKQYYWGKSGSLFLQHKMLSTNQNAGLFGQQHLLVELIDILDFCTVIKKR